MSMHDDAPALPAVEQRIRAWLADLSDLTVAGTEPVTAERIAQTAEHLGRDGFPESAFNALSLHAVAQGQRYFPAYDDIRKALGAWWAENKPAAAPTPAGEIDTIGFREWDHHWLRYWLTRQGESFRPARAGGAPSSPELVLSLIRKQAYRAYVAIQRSRGVHEETASNPTPLERESVKRALADRYNELQPSIDMAVPPNIGSVSRPLSDAALQAARAKAGIVHSGTVVQSYAVVDDSQHNQDSQRISTVQDR